MNSKLVAQSLDHALLQPGLSREVFDAGCRFAAEAGVAALCVKSRDVARARRWLEHSPVALCAVVGFPHANAPRSVTLAEIAQAMADGATEIDAVCELSSVLAGEWAAVEEEISAWLGVVRAGRGKLKVIFETGLIDAADKKRRLCRLCRDLGVDFVKTSTGFATRRAPDGTLITLGATEEDVRLMVEEVKPGCGVKASGGIRRLSQVRRFLELGATRIGTASTEAILAEFEA